MSPGAEHHRVDAGLGVQRRLGPEPRSTGVPDAIAQQRLESRPGRGWRTAGSRGPPASAARPGRPPRGRSASSSASDRARVGCPARAAPTPPAGLRGDHVEGHAAVERGDVHAQAAESLGAHARAGAAPCVQGHRRPGQGGQRAGQVIGARGVTARRGGDRLGRGDAAVAVSDPAAGRLADDGPREPRARSLARKARAHGGVPFSSSPENSTATSRGRRSLGRLQSASASQDGGDGALGVGAAQAVQPSVPLDQAAWGGAL